MARPRRVGTQAGSVVITPASEEPDLHDPTDQTQDAMADLEDEGQRPAEGRIHRMDPATRRLALLDTVDASLIDEAYLRENYGGGQYAVYFWGPKKDNTWGYLKAKGKRYTIDSSVPFRGAPRDRAAAGAVNGNGHSPPPANGTSAILEAGVLQLLNGMQTMASNEAARSRDHSTAMMAMMERLAAPRDSGMKDLLAVVLPVLSPIATALLARKDPVELATQIAALSRSEKSGIGSLHELIELKDALAVLGGNNPENEDSAWIRMLEKVVPGAMEMLKMEAARRNVPVQEVARQRPILPAVTAVPVTAPSAPPMSAPPANASSVAAPSPSPESPMSAAQDEWTPLEPYVGQLIGLIKMGAQPVSVMHTIKVQAPRMLGGMKQLVESGDDYGCAFMCARFPQLAEHQEWVSALLEEFYFDFHPEEDDDEFDQGDGQTPTSEGTTA